MSKGYYPTKADIVVKDVNISTAKGQQLSEIIGNWQFVSWEEALKILQLCREARKRDYEERKAQAGRSEKTPNEAW